MRLPSKFWLFVTIGIGRIVLSGIDLILLGRRGE
jgi:hypothetical protein